MGLSLLTFLLVLGLLVFVHELGHFLVAKLLGIGVIEFGIGFPPRLASKVRHGTRYSINWLPLGGFVKLHGMDTKSDQPDSFSQAAVWKRLLVVVAGVTMNVILAFGLLFFAYLVGFTPVTQPLADYRGAQVIKEEVIVADVLAGSAAQMAGIMPNDVIISLNSERVHNPADIIHFTTEHSGETVQINIRRESVELPITATLQTNTTAPLGVSLASDSIIRLPFFGALKAAALETYGITKSMIEIFAGVIRQIFTVGKVPSDIVGPVGIYQATSVAASLGWQALLSLVIILSLNLAIVNILPIPALDGGYVLFLLTELIFRRKIIKEKVESALTTAGFLFLIFLLIVMTWRDLIRFG